MNSTRDAKSDDLWSIIETTCSKDAFEGSRGFGKLEEEIRKFGLPDKDREPQMLCRLAFSVCPPRFTCKTLVRRHGWIANQDEKWVCNHLGMIYPNARGKVTVAIMRDLLQRLDELREAETAALLRVQETAVTLESIAPRPALPVDELF